MHEAPVTARCQATRAAGCSQVLAVSRNPNLYGVIHLTCPPCIVAAMSQDAAVRVRRAAFSLWLEYHHLGVTTSSAGPLLGSDHLGEGQDALDASGNAEALRQLVERMQDKCVACLAL